MDAGPGGIDRRASGIEPHTAVGYTLEYRLDRRFASRVQAAA